MSRGASKEAQDQLGLERQASSDYGNKANGVLGQLQPFLSQEMNSPSGMSSDDLAAALTSSGQSISGALGAANEASKLRATRTGNGAAVSAEGDSAARSAMDVLSNNALKVKMANAAMKYGQQQAGAGGLQSLYGTDVGASLNALGMGNGSIQAQNQADQGTLAGIMAPFQILGSLGSAAGSIMTGIGGSKGVCMIAEAIWGVEDNRTHIMRAYLNTEFNKTTLGSLIMKLYARFGKAVAAKPMLVKTLTPLFEKALLPAYVWWKQKNENEWRAKWL